MRRLSSLMTGRVAAPVTVAALSLLPQVSQAACSGGKGLDAGASCGKTNNLELLSSIRVVTNTLLFIVGIAAVIVIVIGGLRYIVSGGDPKGTAGAKDSILYAVVGLVVALLAFAIVNFVLNQFS